MTMKDEAARELSAKGAAKGGKARAARMTADERRESAQRAARARWARQGKDVEPETVPMPEILPADPHAGEKPWSMFSGTLHMGSIELQCHVLNDGRRVITQREVVRILSGGRVSGSYLHRIPNFDIEALQTRVVNFTVPGGPQTNHGYEATLLIEICEAYLDARSDGTIHPAQENIARSAEIVMRACARVGIIALIDECTGYQEVRAKQALQAKLQAFIAEQMGEWAKRFPDDFWIELARLEGVTYSPRNRPIRWGKYVMKFVYDAIDADVGKKLREINPDPAHGHNHHQWLAEFGQRELNNHLQQVVAVMRLCNDMDDFRRKFGRAFPSGPVQLELSGVGWD